MKAAIVGCGGIAQVHAKCTDGIVPGGLCAAVDIVGERAEKMTARYGGSGGYSMAAAEGV